MASFSRIQWCVKNEISLFLFFCFPQPYTKAVAIAFSPSGGSLRDYFNMSLILLGSFVTFTTSLAFFRKRAIADVEKFERARERWEADNFLEGEKEEMFELYEQKGYTREQAVDLVNILSKNIPAFVDVMMVEELGILPSASRSSVFLHSVFTFLSFFIGGVIPCILLYLQLPSLSSHIILSSNAMMITSVICAMVLFACGIMFASVTIYRKWIVGILMCIFAIFSILTGLLFSRNHSFQ